MMEDYLDYWEEKFQKMGKMDRRALGIPILGTILWFSYGIVMPNIIIPISYYFERKLFNQT